MTRKEQDVSLATTLAGIPLSTCVYNASGPRTGSAAALAKIAGSAAGAILTKSATVGSQTGNPQPRTWHAPDDQASMNSEGLPNSGIDYYINASTMEETLQGCPKNNNNKPYMVSISGKSLKDNLEMLDRIAKVPKDTIIASVELNLACPNVIGKPIIAYDFEQMHMILKTIADKNYPFVLGLKLPPYLDGKQLQEAATVINDYSKMVRYVVCINTIGNALSVDAVSEAPFIAANGGLAGLSGPAVKYTALANVRQMRQHLVSTIDVVGVGGMESGTDVFNMLLCGATAVQVGTCHWKEGPKCFDRICDELRQVLHSKGYCSVQDVIGKLKPVSVSMAYLVLAVLHPVAITSLLAVSWCLSFFACLSISFLCAVVQGRCGLDEGGQKRASSIGGQQDCDSLLGWNRFLQSAQCDFDGSNCHSIGRQVWGFAE
jgi:dihydroorotate dehydrogenase (fumarate)